MIQTVIQEAPIRGSAEALRRSGGRAVAEFRGVVGSDCNYLRVTFEDEKRARATLQKQAEEATRQFNLKEAILMHRKGLLGPGEVLTYAAAAADHREEALRGLDALLGGLKGLAKKEEG